MFSIDQKRMKNVYLFRFLKAVLKPSSSLGLRISHFPKFQISYCVHFSTISIKSRWKFQTASNRLVHRTDFSTLNKMKVSHLLFVQKNKTEDSDSHLLISHLVKARNFFQQQLSHGLCWPPSLLRVEKKSKKSVMNKQSNKWHNQIKRESGWTLGEETVGHWLCFWSATAMAFVEGWVKTHSFFCCVCLTSLIFFVLGNNQQGSICVY